MDLTLNTFVYKTIDLPHERCLELKVDVYSPSTKLQPHSPVLVYFHSGGLTAGSRDRNAWFPNWLLVDALRHGFTVLVPDYSLLVPASGFDMLDDVRSLAEWIQTELNKSLQRVNLPLAKPKDLSVVGQSAGGYLTYLMATQSEPSPKAIAVFYGMGGNFLDDHHVSTKTSKFQFWMPFHRNSDIFAKLDEPEPDLGIIVATTVDDTVRVNYFSWLLQNGTFLDKLFDRAGIGRQLKEVTQASRSSILSAAERQLIPDLHISDRFPPAYLIHGKRDSAVHVSESRYVVSLLQECGVDHVYLEVDAEHGFDWHDTETRDELAGVIPFLRSNM